MIQARYTTERLAFFEQTEDDAPFLLELMNDPDWLRFIGDRGVDTLEAARAYVRDGAMAMVAQHGFGLFRVELREPGTELVSNGTPIGICGLVRRDGLDDVDLGFALLPSHRGRGFAREAAVATLEFGWREVGLDRIVAITSPQNAASIRLLESLGFDFVERRTLGAGDTVNVYRIDAPTCGSSDSAGAPPGQVASSSLRTS